MAVAPQYITCAHICTRSTIGFASKELRICIGSNSSSPPPTKATNTAHFPKRTSAGPVSWPITTEAPSRGRRPHPPELGAEWPPPLYPGNAAIALVYTSESALGLFSSMSASDQLRAACLARCNLHFSKRSPPFISRKGPCEIREPRIPCTGALYQLVSVKFPLCWVVSILALGGKVLRGITPEMAAGIFRLFPLPAVASQTTPIFGSDCGGGGACLRLLIPRTAPQSCIFWPYAHLVRTRFYHAFYPHKWHCATWLIWTTFSAS